MPKKIRLIDEEPTATETPAEGTATSTGEIDPQQLMKYMEAIDWKLWEMLKLMREQNEK